MLCYNKSSQNYCTNTYASHQATMTRILKICSNNHEVIFQLRYEKYLEMGKNILPVIVRTNTWIKNHMLESDFISIEKTEEQVVFDKI